MIKRWNALAFLPDVLQSHAHFQEAPSQRQEVFSVGVLALLEAVHVSDERGR